MVDYSKWKNIEISDDEDETHPNIDTPSLFRWKHQARIQRMEDAQKEKEDFDKAKKVNQEKIQEVREKIRKGEADGTDVAAAKSTLEELLREEAKIKKKDDELKAKDRVTPWNVDTISQPGFTKTIINTPKPKEPEELTDEEKEKRMNKFIKENEKILKEFGMLRKYDDSKKFLQKHPNLVCEDTANYLVIWCINLEMEDKTMLSQHVAHQCICMQYILELSKQLDVDPRGCVSSFFSKIQVADAEYKSSFDDELRAFKERVSRRAKEKLEAAIKEQEEEDRLARLGPGGLDPVEVFEELPEEMKSCFEKQDTSMLQDVIAKMDPADATYHMQRCIDSGLWIPDKNKKDASKDEPCYETIKKTESDADEGEDTSSSAT